MSLYIDTLQACIQHSITQYRKIDLFLLTEWHTLLCHVTMQMTMHAWAKGLCAHLRSPWCMVWLGQGLDKECLGCSSFPSISGCRVFRPRHTPL